MFWRFEGAFDKWKRKGIGKNNKRKTVEERLIMRLEELCKGTTAHIMIGEKIIDEFEIVEGVGQGCPLSADLFNVAMSDPENEIIKCKMEE